MRISKEFTPPDYGSDPWVLEMRGADADLAGLYETILALSNGHIGTRGQFEQGAPHFHPGMFVNGFHETWPIDYPEAAYGYAKTGQTILFAPDTTGLRVEVANQPLELSDAAVVRRLDLRTGTLTTSALWTDISVEWTRLVSLARRSLIALRMEWSWKGRGSPTDQEAVTVISEWRNRQDTDYLTPVGSESDPRRARSFGRRVLEANQISLEGSNLTLAVETVRSRMALAMAMDHKPADSQIAVES